MPERIRDHIYYRRWRHTPSSRAIMASMSDLKPMKVEPGLVPGRAMTNLEDIRREIDKTPKPDIFPDKVTYSIERFRRLKHKKNFASDQKLESLEEKYVSLIERSFGKLL